MDLLMTAVVDITTLVATGHALKSLPPDGEMVVQRKQRNRLRRELRCAALAYIDTLAKTRRGVVDEALINKCRAAAEQQMPHAVAQQELLRHMMTREAGSLDGMPAARQDLWRLAHLAICLGNGLRTLLGSCTLAEAQTAVALSARLRRRFRKALIAYARASFRTKAPKARLMVRARGAALDEIGPRGAAEAQELASLEAGLDAAHAVWRLGVTRPLLDLVLDWQHREAKVS